MCDEMNFNSVCSPLLINAPLLRFLKFVNYAVWKVVIKLLDKQDMFRKIPNLGLSNSRFI